MAQQTVHPPRKLADEHTLIAQRYAGYLVGHPYRQPQQTTTVEIDRGRRWKEPAVVTDDCLFCVRLTDEEAVRRVAGFQYQIDIEATRTKRVYFVAWIGSGSSDVPEPGTYEGSKINLRRFCELFQDAPTDGRPNGWGVRPLPLVALPLRLKRKLCIEWNHIYLPWMEEEGLEYDFEVRAFYREVDEVDEVVDLQYNFAQHDFLGHEEYED
jgi:hypothetical protein